MKANNSKDVKRRSISPKITAALALAFCISLQGGTIMPTQASEREANGWTYANLEDAGLTLTYPSSWKKTMIGGQPNEPDNILKLSGTLSGGNGWGELALSNPKSELSPPLMLKIMEETYWSKLPEFKGSPEKSVQVAGAKAALEKEISFRQAGAIFSQRYLLFQMGPNVYTLTLTCPTSDYQAASSIWNTAVRSISANTGRNSSVSSSKAASTATKSTAPVGEHSWHSADGGISLSYPANLKEVVVEGEGHLFKAASEQPGRVIAVEVFRGESGPNASLADLSAQLEEKYFLTQKNYQKVGEESCSVGSGGGGPAIVRESTFEANGVKIHHLSAYILSDKYLYAVCLSTAGPNSNEAHQIWSRISSSLSVKH
ncbi:MAG: DcrB-related protein [Cyanobacteria bacterium SZAS LIN-3]|nr:DcrB-related protein [Cyanobacteria bacterium SZAS LIN-3]